MTRLVIGVDPGLSGAVYRITDPTGLCYRIIYRLTSTQDAPSVDDDF